MIYATHYTLEYLNVDTFVFVVEFMHYIIASRSLRKVFISIKGIYFQADIMGQAVTWIVPHKLGYEVCEGLYICVILLIGFCMPGADLNLIEICLQQPTDVDYRIMSTFVDFYTTMLGFVNFQLYTRLGAAYPPKVLVSKREKMCLIKWLSLLIILSLSIMCIQLVLPSSEKDVADDTMCLPGEVSDEVCSVSVMWSLVINVWMKLAFIKAMITL